MKPLAAIRTYIAFLILGLCSAVPVWAGVNLTVDGPDGIEIPTGGSATIGVEAEPTDGASITAMTLHFRTVDGVTSNLYSLALELQSSSGGVFSYEGVIPRQTAPSVDYWVECQLDDSSTELSDEASYTVAAIPSVDSGRFMGFEDAWDLISGNDFSFTTAAGDWLGSGLRVSDTSATFLPEGGSGKYHQILNIGGSYIQSPPVVGGIGTVYFTSLPRTGYQEQVFAFQISTKSQPTANDWETIQTFNYPYGERANFARSVVVNRQDAKVARIVLVGESPYDVSIPRINGAVSFDNILISFPPADVELSEIQGAPEFAWNIQSTKLRVRVDDVVAESPSFNHQVWLYYQWVEDSESAPQAEAWQSQAMLPLGGGSYEGTIPTQDEGYVYYFYACDFEGYGYSRDPDGPGVQPLHDESPSPRYWEMHPETGEATVGQTPAFYAGFPVEYYELFRVIGPTDDYPSGEPATIIAKIEPTNSLAIASVVLHFRYTDGGHVFEDSVEMDFTGESEGVFDFEGVIPRLSQANIEYWVEYELEGAGKETSKVTEYSISPAPSVASGRYMDFEDAWDLVSGSNYVFSTAAGDWLGSGLRMVDKASTFLPDGGAGGYAQILNIRNAYIQSPPIVGGVGTIYFTSKERTDDQMHMVAVQVSTEADPGEEDWQTIDLIEYPYGLRVNKARALTLNRLDVKTVRLIMISESPYDISTPRINGAIAFDNIVISHPPTDVVMAERLRNPGYPARDQETKMRVYVRDTNDDVPSINRRVKVHYQWVLRSDDRPLENAWESAEMLPVGDDLYEGVIPEQRPGFIHYYYGCEFDGYSYARDPDGPGPEPFKDESRSPRYWQLHPQAGPATIGPQKPTFYGSFEVRRYRSKFRRMELSAEPVSAAIDLELSDNEVWQGTTLVTGLTNVNWYFTAFGEYVDDALEFSEGVYQWGDNDQGFPNPPIGGFAELNATNSIVAEMEYNGFLLVRFDVNTLDYLAKRAVYQNFDRWLASKDFFESSLGLHAVTRIEESFDEWKRDGYTIEQFQVEDFQGNYMVPTEDFIHSDITDWGWRITRSRVVQERKKLRADIANKALILSALRGGLGGGTLANSGQSMPLGMEKLVGRVRASINDRRIALFNGGFGWGHINGQIITTTFFAKEMSPGKPYISVLFYFQPGYPYESYYELRLTQSDETVSTSTDNKLLCEIYRWKDDVGTRVATLGTLNASLSIPKDVKITVEDDGGAVKFDVKVDSTDMPTVKDDGGQQLTSGGSVGFITHDAVPSISLLRVQVGGANSYPSSGFNSTTGWYVGGKRSDNSDHWVAEGGSLTRPVPTQHLTVSSAQRMAGESYPDPEAMQPVEVNGAPVEIVVDSLNYKNFSIPLHKWHEGFVEIRYGDGDVDVAIDDAHIAPWRAHTRAEDGVLASYLGEFSTKWTSKNQQINWLRDEEGWAVLEGMVTNAVGVGVGGRDVHFQRTRANPILDQALVSPILTNGIGEIEFFASVDGEGEAHFAIERTDDGAFDQWTAVRVITNATGTVMAKYNIPIRENFGGRIRVILLPTSSPKARLMLDDVMVRDYPPRDDTTWQAYNTLVTDLGEPERIFSGQSAFLNNSLIDDVNGIVDESQPYIQTPSVGTGIGEISFWYRTWSDAEPTILTLKVAPHADTPEEEWKVLTNLVVEAGADYYYFSDPDIYDLDNHVLRLYGDTNGVDRIALDNILVTEPVRAGYEIETVRLLPEQPLAGAEPQIEVDIGRFLMNPKDIEVYLSYHVGTNSWGTTNWWTQTDTMGSRKITLEPTYPGSRTYRSQPGALRSLSNIPVDGVVQYFIWGTHSEIDLNEGDRPITQTRESFENPEWYAPIDLNERYEGLGWSPYYYIYSCPPWSVWVNEVNPHASLAATWPKYVEMIGPATADIGKWRLELLNDRGGLLEVLEVDPEFKLEEAGDGWGFLLWGDEILQNDPLMPDPDYLFTTAAPQVPASGAVAVYRSNGSIEDRVCWGINAQNNLEHLGFTFIGNKGILVTTSLGLINLGGELAQHKDQLTWGARSVTPGNFNEDGGLGENPHTIPDAGGSSYLLISAIGPNGKQNNSSEALISEELGAGMPASITYTSDEWYRIESVKVNGVEVPAAAGLQQYVWQTEGISSDISNNVTFAALTTYGSGVPVAWLSQWSEGQVELGAAMGADIEEAYLLNVDPTAPGTAALWIAEIRQIDGDLHVTVALDREKPNSGFNNGDINGTLVLQGRDSLASGDFTDIAETEVSGAQLIDDEHTYIFENVSAPAQFYRAIIR